MLLTRSIRRKLLSGIGLVVLLVAASTLVSFQGVNSHLRMIKDLEISSGEMPRQSELIASLTLLYTPLIRTISTNSSLSPDDQARIIHQEFTSAFERVQDKVKRFETAWQVLPDRFWHHPNEEILDRLMMDRVDGGLKDIAGRIERLQNPELCEGQRRSMVLKLSNTIDVARQLPDPASRLGERLKQARADYVVHLRLVTVLGVFSAIVLAGLMLWSYQLIFSPIRKLHLGVRRIAEGDYSYRLKIDTQCEISHLADAFNEMALRIQEDRNDKQREIEERSKQLVLSERLAGAGFLASGVAHEINNPLSVIMTAAYGLEARLDEQALSQLNAADRAEIWQYLGLIQSEAERCERITKKLLDFSHGNSDERNRYDVTAIAEEVVGMVGHLSRYHDRRISINRTLPLHAWVNAPEIKQVLLNLTANALDATSAGGQVRVFLKDCPDAIEVMVEDDGCGMTPAQMEHLFDPFYTTKDVGKGTGLGLSISHRIVADHGGTLEAHSDGPGKGARFSVRLPKKAPIIKVAA